MKQFKVFLLSGLFIAAISFIACSSPSSSSASGNDTDSSTQSNLITRQIPSPSAINTTVDASAVIKYSVIDETSKLTDGSEYEYVYDTAVCTAEVDEDTGLLTLKKEGKGSTAVWVRVVNITPEPDEILYRVRYNVNVDGSISADQTGFVQRPYTIQPTTKDQNGNDIENVPLTYESVSSADENVVTATINDDGDLIITPQNPGTTQVTVTTENATGDKICVVYEVTVEEDGTTTVEVKSVAIPAKITTDYIIQSYEVADTDIATASKTDDFNLLVVPANDGTTYLTVYGSTTTVNEENGTDYIDDFVNKYKITVSGGVANYELISSQFNLYPKKNFTAYQSVSTKSESSFASSTLANNVITINAEVNDGEVTPVTNATVTATGKTFYDDDTKIMYRVNVGSKGGWSYSIFQVELDYTKAKGSILRYEWDDTLNDGDYCWKTKPGSYMETADTAKTKSANQSIVRYIYISGLYSLRPVSDGDTTVDAAATDAGAVLHTITNNVKISNSCHVIDYNLAATRVLIPFANLYNSEISKIDLSADGASSTNSNYVFQATSNSVEVECDNNSTVNAVGQTGNVTIVDKDDPTKTATFGTEVITGGIMTYKYPL